MSSKAFIVGVITISGFLSGLCSTLEAAQSRSVEPEFLPSSPSSEFVTDYSFASKVWPGRNSATSLVGWSSSSNLSSDPAVSAKRTGSNSEFYGEGPTLDFCAEWNPEFPYNGHHCCGTPKFKRRRRVDRCSWQRRKTSYCGEMTTEQREYADNVASGKLNDVLAYISDQVLRGEEQSYCSVNNGFLARGRKIVPTSSNRIRLRAPFRCVDFGTDAMIGMLEWVGRQVGGQYSAPEYAGVRLIVGDISAPKGGCLPGRVGRRGHASHTTGQDVDLGFLMTRPYKDSIVSFHRQFDPVANWWLAKQLFKNPYACVKVAFLDRSHIRKLAKVARGDPDWEKFGRFIRHVKSHRNHWHVRIGEGPGQPGCTNDAHPELETEDEAEMDGPDYDNPIDQMPDVIPRSNGQMVKAQSDSGQPTNIKQ
ncbi:MAG TPA: penicillin-insensitive murein endopeptidase [Bdellovibrionota bacterium]|nr:penicillin-insensitive murein endopeptidase [Bdellovibrionota bacterium]